VSTFILPLRDGKALLSGGAVNGLCCVVTPPVTPPDINILMATATSAGGNLQCAMGPVVKTFENLPPYGLGAGTYELRVDFTTGDHRWHQACYYAMDLTFDPPLAAITWGFVYAGTVGDPWSASDAGKSLRYDVEDSVECGGTNEAIQTGTATATIVVSGATDMGFDFSGIAELEDTGYENISFYLKRTA
jgi:hypothetical protein